MTYHIPMCPVCNENEVGSLHGGTEYYCSATCEGIAFEEAAEYTEEFRAEYYGHDFSQYDDDPNPYAGTYSEE